VRNVGTVARKGFYLLGAVTRSIIFSPGFQGAVRGCSAGISFSLGIAIGTLAATGQPELSGGELVFSCAVSAWAGFLDAEREGSGYGLENANRAYEIYNALYGK
jgi:hypothetical protein